MADFDHEWTEQVCIPATHPSLAGHFPDQPVVAGVILLDRLAASLERNGHGMLQRISAVKFRAPLLPDQAAELHVAISAAQVRFRVTRGDELLATGDGELA